MRAVGPRGETGPALGAGYIKISAAVGAGRRLLGRARQVAARPATAYRITTRRSVGRPALVGARSWGHAEQAAMRFRSARNVT